MASIGHLILSDVTCEFDRVKGKLVITSNGRKTAPEVTEIEDDATIIVTNEGNHKDGPNKKLKHTKWDLETVVVTGSGSLVFVGGTPADAQAFFKKGTEVEFATSDDAEIKSVPSVGGCLKLTALGRSLIDSPRTCHERMSLACHGTSHIRVGCASTALIVKCDPTSRILAKYTAECLVDFKNDNHSEVKPYVDPRVRAAEEENRRKEKEQLKRERALSLQLAAKAYIDELDEELEDEERARIYGAVPLEEEVEILDDHVMDAGDIQAVTDKEHPNPERTILDRLADYVEKLRVIARIFGYVRPAMFFDFMVNTSDLQSNLNARQRASLVEKLNQMQAELLSIAPAPGPNVPAKATLESDPRDQCVNCIDMRGDRVLSCGHDMYCEGCITQWILSRPVGSPPSCPQCRQQVKWVRTMGEENDSMDASAAAASSSSSPKKSLASSPKKRLADDEEGDRKKRA